MKSNKSSTKSTKVEGVAANKISANSPSNTKLVWSDDPKDKAKLEDKVKNDFAGPFDPKSRNFVCIFRIEKSGRGGKTVTVIDGLPKFELFLKDLTKELKSKCGVGGTYLMDGKDGIIEIQGDKREAIKALFDKKGFKYKGM
jgi:translation initiation factor 1